jgi:hypothetical protein
VKKETKLFLAMALLPLLPGGYFTGVERTRQRKIKALKERKPTPATLALRRALAPADELRIFVQTFDSYEPYVFASEAAAGYRQKRPNIIYRGDEIRDFMAAIHVEGNGSRGWYLFPENQPMPGSLETSTGLEFYRNGQWMADIRVTDYQLLRWYTPLDYKADGPLLPESRRYLRDIGAYKSQYGDNY